MSETQKDTGGGWSRWAMLVGVAGAYGWLASIGARFLFPSRGRPMAWQYVADTRDWKVGKALLYKTPAGETVNIARQVDVGGANDFVALSSTCPHLGCQVHWEVANERFFCPCHNGIFDVNGNAVSGPPAEAGQSLPRYELKVDRELLYIRVPTDVLGDTVAGKVVEPPPRRGPGHDPCLDRGHVG